jgi:hypothetical protein
MDKRSQRKKLPTAWAQEKIGPAEREQVRDVAESELLGLREGNFARYQIPPSEFMAWQQAWDA